MSNSLIATIAVLVGAIAAATDLRNGRIPNQLTLPAMLLGVAVHGAFSGIAGALESVVGLLVCAAVPGIVYWATKGAAIGGGDLKLFGALGALLGPMHGLEVELSSFLLLGVFAFFRLAYLGQLSRALLTSLQLVAGPLVPALKRRVATNGLVMTEMRMGPAIAVAILTVLGLPHLMKWLPWLG
ncbi:MAG: prepilin peptidase [Myxococcales bacterium]